jgi:hypothetical protein
MKYNNTCPYCRTELQESKADAKELTEDDDSVFVVEEDEDEDEEEDEEETQRDPDEGWVDDDDCYHYPVVIENIVALTKVISEVNGNVDTYDLSKGWLLKILSIMNQNENATQFDFGDDKTIEEDDVYFSDPTTIIDPINIYKRTIMMKKHLKHKYNLM